MLGIDRLLQDIGWLQNQRVGLLSNQAALTSTRQPTLETLWPYLSLLLSPEHGFSGLEEDATPVADTCLNGLRVLSLYGSRRKPDLEALGSIDTLIVDLPDVGVRCYTYATTLALTLEVAAKAGTRVVVCDRPNPLGPQVDGPLLEAEQRSFLGYLPLPYRHGLTMGQIAAWYNTTALDNQVDLRVLPCQDHTGDDPWIPPSPGLLTRTAVLCYPGWVWLEGTNVSEGRGTLLPFQILGAPWLNGAELAHRLNQLDPGGVRFRPLAFMPKSGKYVGEHCEGVQVHLVDAEALEPLRLGALVLQELREYEAFRWRRAEEMPWRRPEGANPAAYEPESGYLLDYLLGSTSLREALEDGADWASLLEKWRRQAEEFSRGLGEALR